MVTPIYPATSNQQAIDLNISNANQFFTILQGGIEDFIPTYEGNGEIPSVAKALNEAAAYKVPIAWETTGEETDLLQPRIFNDDVYVPLTVPAPFSTAPSNEFWRLYSEKRAQVLIDNITLTGDGFTTDFNIPSMVVDDPAAYLVSIDGVDQRPTIDYTVDVATDTLSFTEAPPTTVANNISVTILGALRGALAEDIYETTADGLANTSDGQFFHVVNTTNPEAFIDLYRNNAGAALLIDTYPNSVAYNNLANAVAYEADLSSNAVGDGSDLVAHTGTTDTVTEALNKRTIYVESVAELEALSPDLGQLIHVTGDHFYEVIDGTGYTPEPSVDYTFANGLIAQRRSNGTLTTGRDNFPRAGASPYETLADSQRLKDRKYTGAANPGISIVGRDAQVSNVRFDRDANGVPNQVVYFRNGTEAPIVDKSFFNDAGYQIIQASGETAYGIRAIANTSFDCDNDFVLQNNDSQAGITHSWLISLNYVDQANSDQTYGQTESRGVSFTTCYGGINAINSMVGIKGDSATHLENIQETVHALNYYRDCFADVLFSGVGRRLITVAALAGLDSIEVGDEIVGVTSGATADVLFWFPDYKTFQANNQTGSFQIGESFSVTGKDVTGTIDYIDPVQVHANVLGNVFHKTGPQTSASVDLGVNNYNLRNHFGFNTYNAQVEKGVANTSAVNCAFAYDSDHSASSYRGWDDAFKGSTFVRNLNIRNSYFWNNTDNIDGDVWEDSAIEGNKFFDGRVRIGSASGTRFRNNEFKSGCEIDIVGGAGSEWISNIVESGATITSLSPSQFTRWESVPYSRNGRSHAIRASTNISSGTATKELIATLTGGTNRSASIKYELAARTPTSGGRQYAEFGRAHVIFDGAGTPSVVLDPNNFSNGGNTMKITLDVVGSTVEVNFDYTATGFNVLATANVEIVTEAVTVAPVNFLDRE